MHYFSDFSPTLQALDGQGNELQKFYFLLPVDAICKILLKSVQCLLKCSRFTNDLRQTTNAHSQNQTSICHLSDSGELIEVQHETCFLQFNIGVGYNEKWEQKLPSIEKIHKTKNRFKTSKKIKVRSSA